MWMRTELKKIRDRKRSPILVGAVIVSLGVGLWVGGVNFTKNASIGAEITKEFLAKTFSNDGWMGELPTETVIELNGKKKPVVFQYALDANLQATMERLFQVYKPDYGAFVALDASTGRVLSMVSYQDDEESFIEDHLALRATFPSASIFKVVTAAAAIAENKFSADTVVSFHGRNHTLYKKNVLAKPKYNRWTREVTLKRAFALSINTVFGRIGALELTPDSLRDFASRFGFNRKIQADLPVQVGKALIEDDPWSVAEAASGFTRTNTMSPMQGALIAATVVNQGIMMEPYIVQSVFTREGVSLYEAVPRIAQQSVSPNVASEIRELMRKTVTHGTSRRSFRGFFQRDLRQVDVGGKTGSLTGMDPKGKYDWFVGYGDDGKNRIAIAALTVHRKYWRVKSSTLARKALEAYYKEIAKEARLAGATSLSADSRHN